MFGVRRSVSGGIDDLEFFEAVVDVLDNEIADVEQRILSRWPLKSGGGGPYQEGPNKAL
jgi:hypothetical protein